MRSTLLVVVRRERISWAKIDTVLSPGLCCGTSFGPALVSCSWIAIASCRVLIFLASLVKVLVALIVSESAFTRPLTLVGIVAPMVTDSGVSARFFAVNRDGVLDTDVVSVSERIFETSLVAVLLIVTVSVSVLTMFCLPLTVLATASLIVIV